MPIAVSEAEQKTIPFPAVRFAGVVVPARLFSLALLRAAARSSLCC